jgi:hypothetical protein
MSLKRRQFSREFKLPIIREVEAGKSVAQAAREHQVHPNMISQRWGNREPMSVTYVGNWASRGRPCIGMSRPMVRCGKMDTNF